VKNLIALKFTYSTYFANLSILGFSLIGRRWFFGCPALKSYILEEVDVWTSNWNRWSSL